MFGTQYDDSDFIKQLNNISEYSLGFLDGVKQGTPNLLKNLGKNVKNILENFIDSNARVNPQALHHVYEWYETGNENARLFNIEYKVIGNGLTFGYTFSQSKSIKDGSNVPFYDKANIMENGIPVTIVPKQASALMFDDGEETVFTKKPVTINHPGGEAVQGSFENTFKDFFQSYLSQSLLDVSGMRQYFKNAKDFSDNIVLGKTSGRSAGVAVGKNWISKAGETL